MVLVFEIEEVGKRDGLIAWDEELVNVSSSMTISSSR